MLQDAQMTFLFLSSPHWWPKKLNLHTFQGLLKSKFRWSVKSLELLVEIRISGQFLLVAAQLRFSCPSIAVGQTSIPFHFFLAKSTFLLAEFPIFASLPFFGGITYHVGW